MVHRGVTYLCPDSWAMVKARPSPVSSLMVQLRYLLHIPLMGANPVERAISNPKETLLIISDVQMLCTFCLLLFFFCRKMLKVYRSQSSLNRWVELNTLFLFKDTFSWVLQSSNNFLKEACYLEAQLNATETRQALFSYIALHSRCLGNNLQRA